MKNTDNKITNYYIYSAYAVIVFIAMNILGFSWLDTHNLDVTQEQRFSVSEHSFKIIDSIPEHIDLKLYVSSSIFTQMPTMKSHVERVSDFLEQLEKYSGGRLRISTTRIDSFSEAEDEAIALGLKPVPFKDGTGVFFGIIAENMLDSEGIIPFLNPDREAFVEYDIARLIQGVVQVDKIKVAVASSLPLETGSGGTTGVLNGKSNPYQVFTALKSRYDLIGLSDDYKELLDEKNRPKIALILHPRPLSKNANDNLNQYVATGGRVLIAVDPFSEALPLPIGSTQQNAEIYSDMPDFFEKIGLIYNNQSIILDRNLARKVVNQQTSYLDEYLAWLKLTHDNFSVKSPVMTSINELSFSTVGSIERNKNYKGNLEFIPLVYSVKKADFTTRKKIIKMQNANELGENYQEKILYNIAMLVTGRMDSSNNAQNMAVIVLTDSDFLDDRLWLQGTNTGEIKPFADNLNLVLNYIDFLAGDDALIALRGKKTTQRPLIYLDNIKHIAEKKFIAEEKILKERITDLHKNIAKIEQDYSAASGNAVPEKIKQEVAKFSNELMVSRKQLREVRRHVNEKITMSHRNIKLINVIIMPLCFGFLALFILSIRKAKALKRQSGG